MIPQKEKELNRGYRPLIKEPEPPEGTLVRILKDLPFGHKKGAVGRIEHDPTTFQTKIVFDHTAGPQSLWYADFARSKDDYEIVQQTMKKKFKLSIKLIDDEED